MADQKFNQQQQDQKTNTDKSISPDQSKTDMKQPLSTDKDLNKSSSSQVQDTRK